MFVMCWCVFTTAPQFLKIKPRILLTSDKTKKHTGHMTALIREASALLLRIICTYEVTDSSGLQGLICVLGYNVSQSC